MSKYAFSELRNWLDSMKHHRNEASAPSLADWVDPSYPSIHEDFVHILEGLKVSSEDRLLLEGIMKKENSFSNLTRFTSNLLTRRSSSGLRPKQGRLAAKTAAPSRANKVEKPRWIGRGKLFTAYRMSCPPAFQAFADERRQTTRVTDQGGISFDPESAMGIGSVPVGSEASSRNLDTSTASESDDSSVAIGTPLVLDEPCFIVPWVDDDHTTYGSDPDTFPGHQNRN